MKGITRFAEYSISGGLLWLNVVVFATLLSIPPESSLGLIGSILDVWGDWVTVLESHLRQSSNFDAFKNTINTLAASLFVLLVFCTGLALDLLSPLFCSQLEILFFRNNIKVKEEKWFSTLVKKHEKYLHDDYNSFVSEPLIKISDPGVWRAQKKRFNRINSFIMAYLFVNSDNVYLTQLTDKIRIWYTCRAITTSLLALCVLLNFLSVSNSFAVANATNTFIYTLLIPSILVIISFSITIGTFCRVSNSMLALAYHIDKNQSS